MKQMPASIDAENAVIGSILIKPSSIENIAGIISEDDFLNEDNKLIFITVSKMFLESKSIDMLTVASELIKTGKYDNTTAAEYVRLLAESVPSASNIKDYAYIVHDKAVLRHLIDACDEISALAYSEEEEADKVVDYAEQKIFDLAQKRQTNEFRHVREITGKVYAQLQTLNENPNMITGTKTGFSELDRVLVQMGKGDLVLVGARPGMGKTSFALNVATNVARMFPKTVCIFSLEMSCEQLVSRMLSSEAHINSYSMRSGDIPDDKWGDLATAAAQLSACDILIDDTSGLSVTEMKSKLRRVKNLGLVVVDYLGLMQSGKRIENRVQEVGEISRNLKIMAKDLGIPIICCAQLSRGPESRTDKRPMLSDLRDSGAIEQDADIVIFLYRDEYYKDEKSKDGPNVAEIIVAKNRHGSTDNVKMGWNAEFTQFRTLETNIGEPTI